MPSIGASAIDHDGALLDFDFREVKVAQAIIANARHVILVADATKFERTAPCASPSEPGRHLHHRSLRAAGYSQHLPRFEGRSDRSSGLTGQASRFRLTFVIFSEIIPKRFR